MGKRNESNEQLPVAKAEDVAFAADRADADDLEALARSEEADRRAQQYEGT
ncbi:YfhD family protein [Cohnella rhizosphaerae]|uniref:YfhD family protein n=1 Tax=Cohnella rhizosphaerae TaxID=1457232 RepID=A0A9X4QUV9_9BACL|nr:YfhD family protein [Cohnella rhizosphaerae]MDG0812125.1 YfhD family protein [Cohnella rhizosphaerae]